MRVGFHFFFLIYNYFCPFVFDFFLLEKAGQQTVQRRSRICGRRQVDVLQLLQVQSSRPRCRGNGTEFAGQLAVVTILYYVTVLISMLHVYIYTSSASTIYIHEINTDKSLQILYR